MRDVLSARDRLAQGAPGLTTDVIEAARRACLDVAIVAYCRAFLTSSGANYAVPRLKLRVAPIGKEAWAREMHLFLIKARNKIIAHSDWEHHNTTLIRPEAPSYGAARRWSLPNAAAGMDIPKFAMLASTLLEQVTIIRWNLDHEILKRESDGQ